MLKQKILIASMALVMVMTLFSGCGQEAEEPVATPNENITRQEGRVLDTDPPGVEGAVRELTEDSLTVMVAGEEWKFVLDDSAKRELSIFNEDEENPRILKGTMLNVYYEERDGERYAQKLEIVTSN